MSFITSVGSFIVSNLLDEFEMNPTWEKFRKYTYAVCVVLSLYPLYLTFGLSVGCRPTYLSATTTDSPASSEFIQLYCRNDDDLIPVRYAGWFLQLANVVVLVTSFYWLHIPKVTDAIRTFAEVRSHILKTKTTIDNIKNLISPPERNDNFDEDGRRLLRACCHILQFDLKGKDVCYYYFIRNMLLLVLLVFCSIGCIILAYFVGMIGDTFMCDCKVEDCLGTYKCAINVGSAIVLVTVVYFVGLLIQAAIVAYGIWQTTRGLKEINIEEKFPSIKFMLQLCRNSQPLYSGMLEDFMIYIHSDDFQSYIEESIPVIITRENDLDLTNIVQTISNIRRTSGERSGIFNYLASPDAKFVESKFIRTFSGCKYSIEDSIPLAKLFVKHNLWKSLVKLIEYAKFDVENLSDEVWSSFNQMGINFHYIETPPNEVCQLKDDPDTDAFGVPTFSEIRGSILYHAISSTYSTDKDVNVKVIKFLLHCCSPSLLYVHSETGGNLHKSMTLTQFINESHSKKLQYLQQEISHCQSQRNSSYANTLPLSWQHEYEETLRNHTLKEKSFARVVKRKKFHVWDEDASKFLKSISENQHMEIGVALTHACFSKSIIKDIGRFTEYLPNREILLNVFQTYEYELDDCKDLAKFLAKERYWEMLVYMLGNVKSDLVSCSQDILEYFKQLNVDIDFTGMPFDKEDQRRAREDMCRKNLLWYACCEGSPQRQMESQRQPYFSVAKFILKISVYQKLFIHDGYISHPAVDYAKNQNERILHSNNQMKDRFEELVTEMQNFEGNAEQSAEIPCQKDIGALYRKYEDLLEIRENPNPNESLKEFIHSLSCVRLHYWDDNVKNFAKTAAQNNNWKIVTSLIQGFVKTGIYRTYNPTILYEENFDISFLNNMEAIKGCIECDNPAVPSGHYHERLCAAACYVIMKSEGHLDEIKSYLNGRHGSYFDDIRRVVEDLDRN